MKAYMVKSHNSLQPFGDLPGDVPIINRKLSDLQSEVLQDLGLELVIVSDRTQVDDTEEHIVFVDSLLFTKELLAEFIARSQELGSCTVCALSPGLTSLRTIVSTQDVQFHADRIEYKLEYLPTRPSRREPVPVVIDPSEDSMSVPFPKHMLGNGDYHVAMTDKFLVQIDHWVNLWAANMLMVLVDLARLKKAPPEFLMELAQKAGSMNQWDILRQLNKFGQDCDIHPTAYIEGSTLGNKVTVCAGAVIRNAIVGDGAYISNNVSLQACVIGPGCFIASGGVIQVSMLFPNCVVNVRSVASSTCGRDTFLGEGAALSDFRLDGKTVSVVKDGKQVDTGNPLIGACLGHGVYLGAGCIVAPGRAIPNGLHISPAPSRIIRQCYADGTVPGYRIIDSP